MKAKNPRAVRPGISDEEFMALVAEWARRPGRHSAQSMHDAMIVRALVERHGVKPKKRAILAVVPVARFAVVERAYQKLVRSGRLSYVSDRSPRLRAALQALKGK